MTTPLPTLHRAGYKTAIVLLSYILMIDSVELRIMLPTAFKILQYSAQAKIFSHTHGR